MSSATSERPNHLNFITSNANKLAEVRAILGDVVELQSRNVDVPELQGSVIEIAAAKARAAADQVGGPVLTEDTALEFNALNGLPGPYIKHFLNALGLEGLNKLLAGFPDKSAFTVCTFAFCAGPGEEPLIFQGRTAGQIVEARGAKVFGYDPIFEYQGQTYAEMDKTEKACGCSLQS